MRRIIIAATALVALVAPAWRTPRRSTPTRRTEFSPKQGRARRPSRCRSASPQNLRGRRRRHGEPHAAPLTDIKTTIYGVKANYKGFPTCSAARSPPPKSDTGCPKGALVASGLDHGDCSARRRLAPAAGTPCDPLLDVWNGGGGKLMFFFVISGRSSAAACRPARPRRTRHRQAVGQEARDQDTPLPPDVSTAAGDLAASTAR